jgi:hypothetical protein
VKPARTTEGDKRDILEPQPPRETFDLPRRRPGWARALGWLSLGLAALILIIFGTGFYYLKYRLPELVNADVAKLQSAAAGLRLPGLELGDNPGGFRPDFSGFGGILGLLGGVRDMTRDFSVLAGQARALGEGWPELVLGGRGEELIAGLKEARSRIAAVYEANERLRGLLGFSPWGAEHIPVQLGIAGLKDFLDSLILWLDSDEPRRVLVLLQNPSELRPGGGFVGSYAEVELRRGSADKMEVRDINDADRDSALRIVPPRELQLITKRWRAADANWFFNFPDSAKRVLGMLDKPESYDAVIGVSAKAIGDVLQITGPVELEARGLALDAQNFLPELQRQVQTGQAEGSDYPKEILREFAPLVAAKIVSLDDAGKSRLAVKLGEWAEKKDVQVYFRDGGLQKFFENLGAAGRVFQVPEAWNGDYLAVVFANIGGGKSDLYMKQKVVLQSQINSDGALSNHLVLSRKHAGGDSRYWWYRASNQGYLKVFVPPGAKLAYAKGGTAKKIAPPLNYLKEGYAEDPLVSEMEKSREVHPEFPAVESLSEGGKKVFGIWTKTDLGKTSEIVLDYSRRLPFAPADGLEYQFVFERQSGATGEYFFQINAPVGFRFRENNLPVFEYASSDPPGRLTLTLTLERI